MTTASGLRSSGRGAATRDPALDVIASPDTAEAGTGAAATARTVVALPSSSIARNASGADGGPPADGPGGIGTPAGPVAAPAASSR